MTDVEVMHSVDIKKSKKSKKSKKEVNIEEIESEIANQEWVIRENFNKKFNLLLTPGWY